MSNYLMNIFASVPPSDTPRKNITGEVKYLVF